MSEMLKTGKFIKLSLIKSLTKPNSILSYKLQVIPASNIATQKTKKTENFSAFFKRKFKIYSKGKKISKNRFGIKDRYN